MYFTKEKAQTLSDSMGSDISYTEAEKRAKKVYVLSEPNMRALVKFLNPYDLPHPSGGFFIQLSSAALSRKPILLGVKLMEDQIIRVDCYHPECPKTQEFTLFLKIKEDNTTENYILIPMDKMGKTEYEHNLVIDLEKQNAELVETVVIAVLYGIREGIFQKCGNKNYYPNVPKLHHRLKHIIDVKPYERTVNGKTVMVRGYRRYKKVV